MRYLKEADFNHKFISTFPGSQELLNTPRQTLGSLYSLVNPTPVSTPQLISWSEDLAIELDLTLQPSPEDIQILAGNKVLSQMHPYAACYGGHQFGHWAGQLGDGRAITLGELVSNNKIHEIQLKGAGPTPYSRRADGRAVLRSSVREYLMSEAMFYLGVPTTRALCLISTGESVLRDMFYDGNPQNEPGAIVTRVAPSFLRFGSFEILAQRSELVQLKKLVEYTIDNFYSHINGDFQTKVVLWFAELMNKSIHLIIDWMRVGFVHGVMNTDNMSILGLTIDYGPYSMIDEFNPSFTPNTTDLPGRRYAYGRQPQIAYWNLFKLAESISVILADPKLLFAVLDNYENDFLQNYYLMKAKKLGFEKVNINFFESIDQMLYKLQIDMTIFYQCLIDLENSESKEQIIARFQPAFYRELTDTELDYFYHNIKLYLQNVSSLSDVKKIMTETNPHFILRNYLLYQAIEGLEKGDNSLFNQLKMAIKKPYSRYESSLVRRRPQWANNKGGCSMLSCSS